MSNFLTEWFQALVYVRLTPEKISVRDVRKNLSIEGRPLAALAQDARHTVLAVGEEVYALPHQPGVKIVNPFAHPAHFAGRLHRG